MFSVGFEPVTSGRHMPEGDALPNWATSLFDIMIPSECESVLDQNINYK